jgi:exodeoxyribonuclease VII small subunit
LTFFSPYEFREVTDLGPDRVGRADTGQSFWYGLYIVAKPKSKSDLSEGSPTPKDDELSFEGSIAALGQIVEQLERGDLPLEESLNLFEKGIRLSKEAQAKLDAAEQRIETLLGFDDEQNPVTQEASSSTARKISE